MVLADRYRLDRLLGQGGMGDVWKAWDLRLGRPVAVKTLAASAPDDAAARFRREARTEAHLHHPHIVDVYDFGTQDGRPYLVMQLVEGRTLADELKARGPRPTEWVARTAAAIADGLAEAHRLGVVHRDIKPSNILLDGTGAVKIADFGIARSLGAETATELTRTGAVTGTTAYMSPEAARGGVLTAAADVYSLGCTLYQMLAGRPPFVAEHPLAVLHQHVECPPPPLREVRPGLPEGLEAFVLSMLAKDPRDRPTAAQTRDWFAGESWRTAVPAAPAVPAVPAAFGAPAVFATPGPASGTRALAEVDPVPAGAHAHRRAPVAAGATAAVAAIAAAVFTLAWPITDGHTAPSPSGTRPAPQAAASHHAAAPGARPAPTRHTTAPGGGTVPVSDWQTPPPASRTTTPPTPDAKPSATGQPPDGGPSAQGAPPATPGAHGRHRATTPPASLPSQPASPDPSASASAEPTPSPTTTSTPPPTTDTRGQGAIDTSQKPPRP